MEERKMLPAKYLLLHKLNSNNNFIFISRCLIFLLVEEIILYFEKEKN